MPYIEPEWTNEQKALVMADEVCACVVESYNTMLNLLGTHPEGKEFVKSMRFAASHAAAVKEGYIRAVVQKDIWEVVDEDAKAKAAELENYYPDAEEQRMIRNNQDNGERF
jgi:hypothetical protein